MPRVCNLDLVYYGVIYLQQHMKKINIKELLGLGAYWAINKLVAKKIGLKEAILLQHLIECQTTLFGYKQFYQTYDQITEHTSLSTWDIRKGLDKLKELELIIVERKGTPPKNWYMINTENVISLFDNKSPIFKCVETTSLKCEPFKCVETTSLKVRNSHDKDNKENKQEIIVDHNINIDQLSTDQGEKNILQKYLLNVCQINDKQAFKQSEESIIDYGGPEKIFDILEFSEDVRIKYYENMLRAKNLMRM